MIITSEHDFSSANTYIHLGYASAQNRNVAMHEDDVASGSAGDWKWGSCLQSSQGHESICNVWWHRLSTVQHGGITPCISEQKGAVHQQQHKLIHHIFKENLAD